MPADPTAEARAALALRLGYPPGEQGRLLEALTHKSFANEAGGLPYNERLEFLGDAVLGLVIADALMRAHPDVPEGQLSRLRAGLVNARSLADAAGTLGLAAALRLGKGEDRTGGRQKASLLADAFEATLGAVHRDLGYGAARRLVLELLGGAVTFTEPRQGHRDFKTRLQEYAQARFQQTPSYAVVAERGPDHEKEFEVEVTLGAEAVARGLGRSKKVAERDAARVAWARLHATPEPVEEP